MRLDQWQNLGVICGALLALLTLIGLIYRKVVRPVWRAAWRTIKRLNQVADDLLGDEAKRIPSMTRRMSTLETTVDARITQVEQRLEAVESRQPPSGAHVNGPVWSPRP